jgi:hypothetical protein
MVATATRPAAYASVTAQPPHSRGEIYQRLSLAIRRGDKAKARRIYYGEIIPDKRFGRGEVNRLSFRLGAIDEGDRCLAENADL